MIGAVIFAPVPANVLIDVEFDEPMNQGLTPGDVNVELLADAVPTWGAFQAWVDATHARYKYNVAWPPAAASIQLKVHDTQLQNLVGGSCFTSNPIVIVP